MDKLAPMIALLLIASALAGCTGETEAEWRGPDSNVDDAYVYVDGWTSDDTLCQTAVVLKGGEMYVCTFTLTAEEYIVVELDVASGSDPVDLITMNDINYQKWEDGEAYYYLEDWTDFETFGGQYGKDILMPEGDWNVVFYNVEEGEQNSMVPPVIQWGTPIPLSTTTD